MTYYYVFLLLACTFLMLFAKPHVFVKAAGVCAVKYYQVRRFKPAFMENEDEDSDIKIAGDRTENKPVDTLSDAKELERQRKCGNLEKAHTLGEALSEKIICEDGESTFGQDSAEDEKIRMQRRLLLAFAACNAVETNIKSRVLQGVVLNVFYDSLKNSLPGFYDDISESGSFSFYTLCIRRGGNVERCIGDTFAMLTGREGDQIMEELGEALFMRFLDVANKTIKSFKLIQ